MPEWLKTTLATITFAAVFFGAQAVTSAPQPAPLATPCVPNDVSEMAIVTIEHGAMRCEIHTRQAFAMQCPVEECNLGDIR